MSKTELIITVGFITLGILTIWTGAFIIKLLQDIKSILKEKTKC